MHEKQQRIPVAIEHELDSGILRIGLDRPARKNALTDAMYALMEQTLAAAETNTEVRVVLIHGSPECFSSGNDLDDFNRRKAGVPSPGARFLTALERFEKPVVAAVSGMAIGVGVTLLLHCDLVLAAEGTRFRMPFVNLGLCPEAGSTRLLPLRAGYLGAAKALMLGDFFDTEEAEKLGLVTWTVPRKKLMPQALEQAARLAGKPQNALIITKKLLRQGGRDALREHMAQEFDIFQRLLLSEESKQIRAGMKARRKNQ